MAPSLVQSKSATGTSGTSLTVTLTSNTTAGNCLVVTIGTLENTDNPTVSGITLGGSADNWAAGNTAYSNADANAAIWVDPGCAGGQTSVVISMTGGAGGSTQIAAYVMEWSGLATSSVVDKHPAGQNAQASSWTSGSSGTLTQAVEVAIGVIYADGSGTLTTPGSPWTELAQVTTTSCKLGTGYQVTSATTALTYSGTTSTSNFYGCCLVTLVAASNVSVSLVPATVTISVPAPGVQTGPIALVPATVTIGTPAVIPSTVKAVALTAATVTIAAPAPGLSIGKNIQLTAAAVTITAHAVTPSIPVHVALSTATVTIAAHPVKIPRQLLISIASQAGQDDYGNNFQVGVTSYSAASTGQYAQLVEGFLQVAANSGQYFPGGVQTASSTPGGINIDSGQATLSDISASIAVLGQAAGGTTNGLIELIAGTIAVYGTLNMEGRAITDAGGVTTSALTLNGQTISVPQGSPPTVGAAGTSYSQTTADTWVTALNYLIAVLQNAGIVS